MRYTSPIIKKCYYFCNKINCLTPQIRIYIRQRYPCNESDLTMLSKQVTKIVQNLEKKKFREKYNLFKIEGEKLVEELLRSPLKIHSIIAFPEWIAETEKALANLNIIEVDQREMESISNFQSPPRVIALAEIPEYTYQMEEIRQSLSIVLNGIQDPGNLGTILRVADWFGIRHIFCDNDCAGAYNPKCVQASMGAIFRVKTFYIDLVPLLEKLKGNDFPIFGTFLDGENIYASELSDKGLIVMGNEGKGISQEIGQWTDHKLTIPSFAGNEISTESLNVGVATGIILSEFKRRNY